MGQCPGRTFSNHRCYSRGVIHIQRERGGRFLIRCDKLSLKIGGIEENQVMTLSSNEEGGVR